MNRNIIDIDNNSIDLIDLFYEMKGAELELFQYSIKGSSKFLIWYPMDANKTFIVGYQFANKDWQQEEYGGSVSDYQAAVKFYNSIDLDKEKIEEYSKRIDNLSVKIEETDTNYKSLVDLIATTKERELKKVAKNVRHKACELVNEIFNEYEYNSDMDYYRQHIEREIMNIKFEDVNPE